MKANNPDEGEVSPSSHDSSNESTTSSDSESVTGPNGIPFGEDDNTENETGTDDTPSSRIEPSFPSTSENGESIGDDTDEGPSLEQLFEPDHPDSLESNTEVDWDAAFDTIFGSEPATPDDPHAGLSNFVENDDDHDFLWKIGSIAEDWQNGDYDETEALHRVAEVVVDHYHCVRPHEEAAGVRDALYVYEGDEVGIYSPRGKALIESVLEEVLGRYLRNAKLAEIFGHVDRMALELDDSWFQPPPYEAVIENGIIDFRTGEVRDCTHEEFYTEASRIEHEYDGNASCPEIRVFLESIVDEDDVDTLVHIAAHALVNAYPTRKAHMLVGDGSNGKSVFLRLLEAFIEGELVDEDEQKDKVSNVELADIATDEHAAADLYGKRLNVGSDISSGTLKDLNVFKKATGGDPIRARRLYENSFTFKNKATMTFALNEVPEFDEDTHAVWSRWVMINFPNEFHPGDEDYVPEEELLSRITSEEELEGLFALCVEHLVDALNGGEWWPNVDGASKQREKMKKAAEPFYAAAMACFVPDEDGKVKTEDAREVLRAYARREGLPMGTEFEDASDFGSAMKSVREYDVERKQRRFSGDAGYAYTGISLSPRGLQVLQDERPGEKILSSIEGQGSDDAEVEASNAANGSDLDAAKRAGAEVMLKSIIGRLNEQNASGAEYRAIVEHCRENNKLSGEVIDAIGTLEERGEIIQDDNGTYQIAEDAGDSVTGSQRRTVVREIRDAMSHEYEEVSKSAVAGQLSAGLAPEVVDEVLVSLEEDGHVVLSKDGDRVTLVETATQILNGGDAE